MHAGFLGLLGQLTEVGECDEGAFLQRFAQLQQQQETYKIFVIEGEGVAGVAGDTVSILAVPLSASLLCSSAAVQPLPRHAPCCADVDRRRLIASATLLVELKFIHGCAKCGHIEDVVVDASCRGMRLGARIVDALVAASREAGCYKVILDCSEDNVPFYEKCGLVRKGAQMAKYFDA